MPACLPVCLLAYLPTCFPCDCLPACLPADLPSYLPTYLLLYLPSLFLPACLPTCLVCLSCFAYLSTPFSILLPICHLLTYLPTHQLSYLPTNLSAATHTPPFPTLLIPFPLSLSLYYFLTLISFKLCPRSSFIKAYASENTQRNQIQGKNERIHLPYNLKLEILGLEPLFKYW